jgi:hypothetical protein
MPESKTTCSRRSRHRVQGRPLDRSLCDDHVLVPYIEPFENDSPASPEKRGGLNWSVQHHLI